MYAQRTSCLPGRLFAWPTVCLADRLPGRPSSAPSLVVPRADHIPIAGSRETSKISIHHTRLFPTTSQSLSRPKPVQCTVTRVLPSRCSRLDLSQQEIRLILAATTAACLIPGMLSLADADDVDRRFVQCVAPLLKQHCSACHNADDPEHKLKISTRIGTLRGSPTGPVVTPGKTATCLLWQVLGADAKPHMPPDDQLSPKQISTIAAWIDGLDRQTRVGQREISAMDRQHWSFQSAVRASLPAVENTTWPRTGIDRFVLARLDAAQLTLSPPAEAVVLLRRLYFDLIGLPPSPAETATFLNDDSEDAYQRVVDRLLASPGYGERWGRH